MVWGVLAEVSGCAPSVTTNECGLVLSHSLPRTTQAREGEMGWIVRYQLGATHLGEVERGMAPQECSGRGTMIWRGKGFPRDTSAVPVTSDTYLIGLRGKQERFQRLIN